MNQQDSIELERNCGIGSDDKDHSCVALISPKNLIAEGIRKGLEKHKSILIRDCYTDSNELLNSERNPCYEIILINASSIQYPLSDFFKQLLVKTPSARIMVFGADPEQHFLKSLMRTGVYGFINIDSSIELLGKAILSVKAGQLWFDKSLLDEIVIDALEFEKMIEHSIKDRISTIKEQMTERESNVFCLVLEGLSTKQIAAQIHMSEPTVKQHLTSLFKKFDVNNRSQLILSAFERVCPVTNMIKLFRRTLDKRRVDSGATPLISDPLLN